MSATRPRTALLACPPDAKLCHLVHRAPQDGDHRLDRRPDRGRDARRLGRLELQRRIQAARLRLPGSLRPARNEVPGAVGRHRADRLQGRRPGSNRRPSKKKMDGVFADGRQVPPRQRSRQPLRAAAARPRSATTARSPTRRSSSTSPTTSSTKTTPRQIDPRSPRRPRGTASRSSSAASRSRKPRQEEGGDSSFAIGLLAAVVILLLTFGSVVAMGLPLITALFALGVGLSLVTLGTHVFDTANFAPQLAAMIGLGVGIDYALFILTRFRNGLDDGLEPRDGGDRRRRHRRPGRPLRRDHGDHLADGHVPARPHLPLRGGDGGGAGGAVHDDRRADPAAGAADDRRPPGRPAAHPRPRQRARRHRRRHPLVPLEPRDPAPALCSRRCSPAASCSPSASRPSRCGSAPTTPAPTPPGRPRARPTTCSPRASGPASTAPSRWSRRCPARATTQGLVQLRKTLEAKRASPT